MKDKKIDQICQKAYFEKSRSINNSQPIYNNWRFGDLPKNFTFRMAFYELCRYSKKSFEKMADNILLLADEYHIPHPTLLDLGRRDFGRAKRFFVLKTEADIFNELVARVAFKLHKGQEVNKAQQFNRAHVDFVSQVLQKFLEMRPKDENVYYAEYARSVGKTRVPFDENCSWVIQKAWFNE